MQIVDSSITSTCELQFISSFVRNAFACVLRFFPAGCYCDCHRQNTHCLSSLCFPQASPLRLSTLPPPPSTPISQPNLVVVVVNVVNFDVFTRHWTVFDLTGSFSHNADLSTFSSNIYLCLSPYFHGTFRLFGFVPSCLAFLLGLLHRPTERIADLIGRRRLD